MWRLFRILDDLIKYESLMAKPQNRKQSLEGKLWYDVTTAVMIALGIADGKLSYQPKIRNILVCEGIT